jgi:hypothetical protein
VAVITRKLLKLLSQGTSMWGRYLEILVGLWLVASPSLIPHPETPWRQLNELICGIAVVVFAIASFFRPTRWAHLLTGVVAVWLGASAYFIEPRPGPPGAQNDITIALLLIMMFLIPNEASRPPVPWRGRG